VSEWGRNILEIQVLYHPPMKEVKAHKGQKEGCCNTALLTGSIIDITVWMDGWVKHKGERART
jgi:hypothetical protein